MPPAISLSISGAGQFPVGTNVLSLIETAPPNKNVGAYYCATLTGGPTTPPSFSGNINYGTYWRLWGGILTINATGVQVTNNIAQTPTPVITISGLYNSPDVSVSTLGGTAPVNQQDAYDNPNTTFTVVESASIGYAYKYSITKLPTMLVPSGDSATKSAAWYRLLVNAQPPQACGSSSPRPVMSVYSRLPSSKTSELVVNNSGFTFQSMNVPDIKQTNTKFSISNFPGKGTSDPASVVSVLQTYEFTPAPVPNCTAPPRTPKEDVTFTFLDVAKNNTVFTYAIPPCRTQQTTGRYSIVSPTNVTPTYYFLYTITSTKNDRDVGLVITSEPVIPSTTMVLTNNMNGIFYTSMKITDPLWGVRKLSDEPTTVGPCTAPSGEYLVQGGRASAAIPTRDKSIIQLTFLQQKGTSSNSECNTLGTVTFTYSTTSATPLTNTLKVYDDTVNITVVSKNGAILVDADSPFGTLITNRPVLSESQLALQNQLSQPSKWYVGPPPAMFLPTNVLAPFEFKVITLEPEQAKAVKLGANDSIMSVQSEDGRFELTIPLSGSSASTSEVISPDNASLGSVVLQRQAGNSTGVWQYYNFTAPIPFGYTPSVFVAGAVGLNFVNLNIFDVNVTPAGGSAFLLKRQPQPVLEGKDSTKGQSPGTSASVTANKDSVFDICAQSNAVTCDSNPLYLKPLALSIKDVSAFFQSNPASSTYLTPDNQLSVTLSSNTQGQVVYSATVNPAGVYINFLLNSIEGGTPCSSSPAADPSRETTVRCASGFAVLTPANPQVALLFSSNDVENETFTVTYANNTQYEFTVGYIFKSNNTTLEAGRFTVSGVQDAVPVTGVPAQANFTVNCLWVFQFKMNNGLPCIGPLMTTVIVIGDDNLELDTLSKREGLITAVGLDTAVSILSNSSEAENTWAYKGTVQSVISEDPSYASFKDFPRLQALSQNPAVINVLCYQPAPGPGPPVPGPSGPSPGPSPPSDDLIWGLKPAVFWFIIGVSALVLIILVVVVPAVIVARKKKLKRAAILPQPKSVPTK